MIPQRFSRLLAFAALCAAPAFAMDEYPTVDSGKVEFGLTYAPAYIRGLYDNDGSKLETENNPVYHVQALQVKVGLAPGLDLETEWTLQIESHSLGGNDDDGEADAGLLQPEFGLKYMLGRTGLGVFGNVSLPLLTGSYSQTPSLGNWMLEPGLIYNKIFGRFYAVAKASYAFAVMNSDDLWRGNVVNVFLKPGYLARPDLTVYLGGEFLAEGDATYEGENLPTGGHVFAFGPGLRYQPHSRLAFELNGLFSVAGSNALSFAGGGASVFLTAL